MKRYVENQMDILDSGKAPLTIERGEIVTFNCCYDYYQDLWSSKRA